MCHFQALGPSSGDKSWGYGASLDGGGGPSLSASPDRSSMESRTRLPPEEMKTARAGARAVGLARGRCVAPLPKSAAFVPRNHGWQERGGEIDPGQSDEAIDDARHRVRR